MTAFQNRRALLASIAIAVSASASCQRASGDLLSPLQGSLILAEGNRLTHVDLRTRADSLVKDYTHRFIVDHLNALNRDTLVLDVCNVRTGCTIRALSLRTGMDRVLGTGWGVTVDPTTRTAFFFDQREPRNTSLYSAPLSDLNRPRKIVDVRPPETIPSREAVNPQARAVVVSAGNVVYVGTDRALWTYDPRSDGRRQLGIRDCSPVLARTATGELLCVNLVDGKWYLANLSRGEKRELASATGAFSATYVPASDVLFVGVPRAGGVGERSDIRELVVDSNQVRPFLESRFFSTAVWIP